MPSLASAESLETLEQALLTVENLVRREVASDQANALEWPSFGYWFRGQVDASWDIEPSVFRSGTLFDETSLFTHFQVLGPEHHHDHRSDFDWLCLMQHHKAPTRLVDWSENLLVALFFALWDESSGLDETRDGAIFVLAARRLNRAVSSSHSIFVPHSFHTVARAVLARAETLDGWSALMKSSTFSQASSGAKFLNDAALPAEANHLLASPIAVFPNRINRRLIAQAGTFTIHGGKRYPQQTDLPQARSLESLNHAVDGAQKFIWKFTVPKDKKRHLRDKLKLFGLHEGVLFPDVDHESTYLRALWNRAQRSIR